MSHANVDMLSKLYEAFGKGDVPAVLGRLSDDVTFHVSGTSPCPGTMPARPRSSVSSDR